MAIEDVQVVYRGDRWRIEVGLHGYDTQAEAWEAAAEVARVIGKTDTTELYVRSKRRGWWWKRNTYGNDPRKSKG